MATNTSPDLVWEIVNSSNSFLVKRRSGGGVQLSRDPLNLVNRHSRKHAGFVNNQAIGVQPSSANKGGITLTTKNNGKASTPAKSLHTAEFGAGKGSRAIYRSIVSSTAKRGYRADLRAEAVARASAIKRSQKQQKETPAPKLRGAKARKAAAGLDE